MINYFFEDVDAFEIDGRISPWLTELIIAETKKPGTINYVFCSDEYLLEVNKQYLDHDYFTDIITFDYVKGKTISGDIFVSLPRIFDNALALSTNQEEEFRRVLAHGVLHLCGYKDKSDEEQKQMRHKEDYYLSIF